MGVGKQEMITNMKRNKTLSPSLNEKIKPRVDFAKLASNTAKKANLNFKPKLKVKKSSERKGQKDLSVLPEQPGREGDNSRNASRSGRRGKVLRTIIRDHKVPIDSIPSTPKSRHSRKSRNETYDQTNMHKIGTV